MAFSGGGVGVPLPPVFSKILILQGGGAQNIENRYFAGKVLKKNGLGSARTPSRVQAGSRLFLNQL
jgi:hypothetical protein